MQDCNYAESTHKQAWLSKLLALLASASTLMCFASPANAQLSSSYHDNRFDIQVVECVSAPVAKCTFTVHANRNSLWDYSEANSLIGPDGRPIKAVTMSVAGDVKTLPNRYSAKIEAGTKVTIDLEFPERVSQGDVQALVINVGHWTAKTISLAPVWKKR